MQSHESSAINNNEGTPVPTTTMTTTADAAALLAEIASLKSQLVQLQSSEHLAQSRLERIERAVGPFIPKQFVELLGRTDFTELELGDHKERKLTILFLDIRNFTRMSEDLPPAGVFDLVNAFLGALEPEIEKARGFVDKYVGDSIMALFPGSPGSPAGAEDAIAGAEAMLVALDKFNQDRVQKGLQEVKVGIGLNTGPAIVGTVGGLDRMETTVLSDAVNLASRLESATKVYGVPLLISEATLYALGKPPGPTTRYLDRIRVKGKLQPQSIYEVFSKDPKELREAKTATRSKFEEGVALYHMKQVDRALLLFQECLRVAPDDRPAQVYLERCHVFKREGKHETTGELEGTVEWRREFDLGVDAIDEQHRELLSRMNLLGTYDRGVAGKGKEKGRMGKVFFSDYSRLMRFRFLCLRLVSSRSPRACSCSCSPPARMQPPASNKATPPPSPPPSTSSNTTPANTLASNSVSCPNTRTPSCTNTCANTAPLSNTSPASASRLKVGGTIRTRVFWCFWCRFF